jgi:hypothetical protein
VWGCPHGEEYASRYLNHSLAGVTKLASMRQHIFHLRRELAEIRSRLDDVRSQKADDEKRPGELILMFKEMMQREREATKAQIEDLNQCIKQQQSSFQFMIARERSSSAEVLKESRRQQDSFDELRMLIQEEQGKTEALQLQLAQEMTTTADLVKENQQQRLTILNQHQTISELQSRISVLEASLDHLRSRVALKCKLHRGGGGGFYTGCWLDGVWGGTPHGQGRREYGDAAGQAMSGAVYEGDMVCGLRHGQGKITWMNGAVYDGEWENDKVNGQGAFSFPNGDFYQGCWVNGKFQGVGEYRSVDGSVYVGEYFNNNKHGQGKQINADGSIFHDGIWVDDSPADPI